MKSEQQKHLRRPSQMPLQSKSSKSIKSPQSTKSGIPTNTSAVSLNIVKPWQQQIQAVELLSQQNFNMVNEKLQSLIACVESNSNGLQNSLSDIKEAAATDQLELETYCNQMIQQFHMFYQYVHDQSAGVKAFMDQSQLQVDENLRNLEMIAHNNEMEAGDFEDITGQLEQVKQAIQGVRDSQYQNLFQVDQKMLQLQLFIQK